ncbi:hypothetical protein DFH09DRAFT_1285027 [Mycena vulgaris]|nr:hypothetical protein DFH09DRAFT_1285027 [Mycena vulgaris]
MATFRNVPLATAFDPEIEKSALSLDWVFLQFLLSALLLLACLLFPVLTVSSRSTWNSPLLLLYLLISSLAEIGCNTAGNASPTPVSTCPPALFIFAVHKSVTVPYSCCYWF